MSDLHTRIVDWLCDPKTHGDPPGGVTRITTHANVIILAGSRAYKLKRPVKLAYLDYSQLSQRRHNLERELQLNARTAPRVYLRVLPVFQGINGFSLGEGTGAPVEWLLEMQRFDPDLVLDRVAARGELDGAIIDRLASLVAAFHARAEQRPEFGSTEAFARLLLSNDSELRACGQIEALRIAALTGRSQAFLRSHALLVEERRNAGFVRQCHGDLHLGNIVLIDGTPTLFDCIEFSDEIACIDTLYDLAFLIMDFIHSGRRDFANRLLNGYLWALPFAELAATLDGLALMPLFVSCRAAIRAHVVGRRLQERASASERALLSSYFALSERALAPGTPRLIAIGGFSGSGKTTLARALAPRLGNLWGGVLLRTDVLRKQALGAPLTSPLPEAAYTKAAAAQTYGETIALARQALGAGQAVILDGVFSAEAERQAARTLAHMLGVSFEGLWLEAGADEMARRLTERHGDASDATADVLQRQLGYDLGTLDWPRLDASGPFEAVLTRACAKLRLRGAS